jgi:hypothetical protein
MTAMPWAPVACCFKEYAAKPRLEVREVHAMALREFFARHGLPAEAGER